MEMMTCTKLIVSEKVCYWNGHTLMEINVDVERFISRISQVEFVTLKYVYYESFGKNIVGIVQT